MGMAAAYPEPVRGNEEHRLSYHLCLIKAQSSQIPTRQNGGPKMGRYSVSLLENFTDGPETELFKNDVFPEACHAHQFFIPIDVDLEERQAKIAFPMKQQRHRGNEAA